MEGRSIWSVRPVSECWEKTGRKPVSVRWVDTDKGFMGEGGMEVRSRLVARDFKGNDKGRDDLFADTPPLEAKRMLISRAATRRVDGKARKLMFIDVRKAHLNPVCEDDVYIELPEECGEGKDKVCLQRTPMYGTPDASHYWKYTVFELVDGDLNL